LVFFDVQNEKKRNTKSPPLFSELLLIKLFFALFLMTTQGAVAQNITGDGTQTANFIPHLISNSQITNSVISQGSGNNLVGIGTTTPRATLDIVRQCASNNLAAILIEQSILSAACSGGQTYGTDYMVIRQFNSVNITYQHYLYVNGIGRVTLQH